MAAVEDSEVLAYCEEERLCRVKHAPYLYPARALRYCLEAAGVGIAEVEAVVVAHDVDAYSNGRMAAFHRRMRREHRVDPATLEWQRAELRPLNGAAVTRLHHRAWRSAYPAQRLPPVVGVPHHYAHAFLATQHSGLSRSICLTADGSGDHHCTVVWLHEDATLTPLREICMPHSLGWFYAAITEYLGFAAYDGEYKVMGLAAYGSPDADVLAKLGRVVRPADDGIEYRLDPRYIHYGPHSHSGRFTDHLVDLLGLPPLCREEPPGRWHQDLAWAAQALLEEAALRLVGWATAKTGIRDVCVGGGVGLNVKMNLRLSLSDGVDRLYAHPLCGDPGLAIAAPLALAHRTAGTRPRGLPSLALGPDVGSADV